MPAKRLPKSALYEIRALENFHAAMRDDIELLHKHRAYLSLTTVILCCVDAIAAGSGDATRAKFKAFVEKHFRVLCRELNCAFPAADGADTLYSQFRNGFAHRRGPKNAFVIAEDHELDGAFAGEIEIEGLGKRVALNVDRLTREFLAVLNSLSA